MAYTTSQKLAAEFLGTGLFFYVVSASDSDEYVPIGLFVSLIFFGAISGGHLNPAITMTQMLIGGQSVKEGLSYIAMQCFGGLSGVLLCYASTNKFKTPLIKFDEVKYEAAFSEFLGQAGFLFMVLSQVNAKTRMSSNPLVIYFLICLALYTFRETAKLSSAVLNPAVAITFQVFSWMKTSDMSHVSSLWVFLLCDFGAAAFVSVLYQVYCSYCLSDKPLYEDDENQTLVNKNK